MSKLPFDDDTLRQAMQEKVNHDAAAENRAVIAALRVFDEQKQASAKKAENPVRGFLAGLRQPFQNIFGKEADMNLRNKWTYAVPVFASLLVVGYVGLQFADQNPYAGKNEVSTVAASKPSAIGQLVQNLGHDAAPKENFQSLAKVEEKAASGGAVSADASSVPPAPPPNVAAMESQALAAPRARADYGAAKMAAPAGAMRESLADTSSSYMPPRDYPRDYPYAPPQENTHYSNAAELASQLVTQEPVSTFSLDVDTASYTILRHSLAIGQMPPQEAVRVEEMVNYFPYAYKAPESIDKPFAFTVSVYPTPWNANTKLMHIGLKTFQPQTRPKANIVFLVDVSGSMNKPDRLPLLQNALIGFVDDLREGDKISIVTYAGRSGVILEPTDVKDAAKIKTALSLLTSGGGTAGAAGLNTAYDLAQKNFDKEATNRVILATDGDFNIGMRDPTQLQHLIETKRESGVYLTILGVGDDNLNDETMQRLAQYGNGTAAYLDNMKEAQKVLNDQVSKGMVPVANDAKVQVEFNPTQVSEYRLIGYETRALRREDFNNDKVDAGDVGAGTEVTAIYEITPVGAPGQSDPLRYGEKKVEAPTPAAGAKSDEYAFLKLRYKKPGSSTSILLTEPVGHAQEAADISKTSDDARFATAVAWFGQMLRHTTQNVTFDYDKVIALAKSGIGTDPGGLRQEFVGLVKAAKNAEISTNLPIPEDVEGPIPQTMPPR